MKKIITLAFSLLFVGMNIYGQETASTVVRCATDEYMKKMFEANPALKVQRQKDELLVQQGVDRLNTSKSAQMIFTIPVVVHVVYRTATQNISDAQVQSQIDALNEDFARLNADTVNTPAAFKPYARATNFRFCLAQQDTNGNPTNGIERRLTTTSSFSTNNGVKAYATGGLDAWDVNRYLNIWVCNMSGGILGYGEFPLMSHTTTYGLVIQYNAFGRVGTLQATYNLGRTTVHEISHCFNLYHIWGDDGGTCGGSDYCPDTPNQGSENYGCRTYPYYDNCATTGNGVMFMNYMDYSDDVCLNMFTTQQSFRMNSAMSQYYPTLLSSTACEAPTTGISNIDNYFNISAYPNPTDGIFNLDMFLTPSVIENLQLVVVDQTGRLVLEEKLASPSGQVHQLDLRNQPSGVYTLTVFNDKVKRTFKIALVH